MQVQCGSAQHSLTCIAPARPPIHQKLFDSDRPTDLPTVPAALSPPPTPAATTAPPPPPRGPAGQRPTAVTATPLRPGCPFAGPTFCEGLI